MAEQITDKLIYPGGYIDEIMSVESFDNLLELSRGDRFVGLTVTVTNALNSLNSKSIPVDVWLSESKSGWVLKNVPPVDNLDILKTIPANINIPEGFDILLKSGETYKFRGLDEDGNHKWDNEISRDEFDTTISDMVDLAVEAAVEKITSGASEAFDTLKEIEDWLTKNSSGGVITPDLTNYVTKEEFAALEIPSIEGLATSADVVSAIEEVKTSIPSIEGLASETFVKNAIAEAKLSGDTNIDLTGYATKDDIKDLAHKDDIKSYKEGTSILIDSGNQISVKIAKDTEEKENFIEVNENNELVLNTITLDATVISEDIEVNGGAWADEVETVFNGKIPAGITFEEFLKKMLKKEKYASNFEIVREFTVTAPEINPGIIAADKNVNGQIVEVGTKVTIGAINPTSTKAIQSLSAGTFTYGYKVGENGTLINSQLYTEKLTPTLVKSASTLQVLFTNITKEVNGSEVLENIFKTKENEEDVITIDTITGYVNKGYNSVRICQTGDTYATNTAVTGNLIYVATSLGNFYTNDEVTPNICEIDFPESEITAMTQTIYQVSGASKYYIGGIFDYYKDYWVSNRSDEIRNLETQGWAIEDEIEVPYIFKKNTKQQTVAVPAEYTKVIGRDRLNGPVEFKLVSEGINFYNSQGYSSKYNVFVAPVLDGLSVESFINITISKK